MGDFKTMYGKDSEFVDVTSVTASIKNYEQKILGEELKNGKRKKKYALMGLVLIAMMYMLLVIAFILDGAPFHP